jgi:hypothetical protein
MVHCMFVWIGKKEIEHGRLMYIGSNMADGK